MYPYFDAKLSFVNRVGCLGTLPDCRSTLREYVTITRKKFYYSVFRLLIKSPFPFSNYSREHNPNQKPDIIVRLNESDADQTLPADLLNAKASRIIDPKHVLVVTPPVQFCYISEGREVVIRPAAEADEGDITIFLQTTVLQILMHQRGYFLLHGSAVNVNGSGIVFIARSTGGKSTLVAYMVTLGFPVIADDLVAIQIGDERMVIIPSKPHLRLWPDAALYMGKDIEKLPRVLPAMEKRIVEIDHGTDDADVPLGRIFSLEFGTSLGILPLNFQESFQDVMKNMTFSIFYANDLEKFRDESLKLMNDCAKVATTIRVARLQRPRSLELLPQVVDMIIHDLDNTTFSN